VSSSRTRRPAAVLGAVVVAAILLLGLARMLDGGAARDAGGLVLLVLWCGFGVAALLALLLASRAGRAPEDDGRTR
jgi:hypothetical protein